MPSVDVNVDVDADAEADGAVAVAAAKANEEFFVHFSRAAARTYIDQGHKGGERVRKGEGEGEGDWARQHKIVVQNIKTKRKTT